MLKVVERKLKVLLSCSYKILDYVVCYIYVVKFYLDSLKRKILFFFSLGEI